MTTTLPTLPRGTFIRVKVLTPEEGYDPKRGIYSPDWEPEVTTSSTPPGEGVVQSRRVTCYRPPASREARVAALAAFYASQEGSFDDSKEGVSPFTPEGLGDNPLFDGLEKSAPPSAISEEEDRGRYAQLRGKRFSEIPL